MRTHHYLYPALQTTDACNKRCSACLRPPGQDQHRLTYEKLQNYLEDLERLASKYKIGFQFITGGEPTIWKDKDKDLTDILAEFDGRQFLRNPTVPTNGSIFEDRARAREFLEKLSAKVKRRVILGLSVTFYQENLTDEGCLALDNLLDICRELNAKIMPVILVTLARDDDTAEKLSRLYPEVQQRVTALAPLGWGDDFQDQCPALPLVGNDKSGLGSFYPHFRRDVAAKLNVSEDEFDVLDNDELFNRLSFHTNCGDSPFIGKKWHYCLPYKDNPRFDLAELGEMDETTIPKFLKHTPSAKAIREKGVLSAAQDFQERLSPENQKKFQALFEPDRLIPVAYRGCMLCREIAACGVWDEMDEGIH